MCATLAMSLGDLPGGEYTRVLQYDSLMGPCSQRRSSIGAGVGGSKGDCGSTA